MSLYDIKKNIAINLLKLSLKYNAFDKYMMGYPGYDIPYMDEGGRKIFDPTFSIAAIYEYYTNTDDKFDKKFYDTLFCIVSSCKGSTSLANAISIFRYHMVCEKTQSAPFKIDSLSILEALKKNVSEYRHLYEEKKHSYFSEITYAQYFDNFIEEIENRFFKKEQ